MSDTTPVSGIAETDRVRLAAGVMLRYDRRREQWMLIAPERLLVLDEMALAIVRACCTDPELGSGVVGTVIDRLAAEYDAPRGEIAADVLELLTNLRNTGYLTS